MADFRPSITRPWLEGLRLKELRDLAQRYSLPLDGQARPDLIQALLEIAALDRAK